jgi:DNA-binding XRE family transcriptional regulator
MIGDVLKRMRIIYGYKASEMSSELGISASYLSEIENNKKQPSLDFSKNMRIFTVSDCPLWYYFLKIWMKQKSPAKELLLSEIWWHTWYKICLRQQVIQMKNKVPIKKYDITQCALYKCRTKKRLEYLLCLDLGGLKMIDSIIGYHKFEIDKKHFEEKEKELPLIRHLKLSSAESFIPLSASPSHPAWMAHFWRKAEVLYRQRESAFEREICSDYWY